MLTLPGIANPHAQFQVLIIVVEASLEESLQLVVFAKLLELIDDAVAFLKVLVAR